jgi:hemolysin activation/secretion protein
MRTKVFDRAHSNTVLNIMSESCLDECPGDFCQRDGNDGFERWLGFGLSAVRRAARSFLLALLMAILATRLPAAEPAAPAPPAGAGTNAVPRFDVRAYVIESDPTVFSNAPTPALSVFTGASVGLERIVAAASDTLLEYQKRGYTNATVSIAQEMITNGIVTMYVFQGAFPQVLISGESRFRPGEPGALSLLSAGGTNAAAGATNATAAQTNAGPHFLVRGYRVTGNTLLSDDTLNTLFSGHTGTNVSLTEIRQATLDLRKEYLARGYPTVSVTIPQQRITNATVELRVFEGRLSEIIVSHNNYFSSNNVMRALPSLHTNTILVGPVFQAELDRANVNQDRQIYPQIEPGLDPDTTLLRLGVKDRIPLHAKVEFNNQSSPGTPDLRVNTSAVYNNLWQFEHSFGVQYSFSPELYKQGNQWDFYDSPQVANYSAFYRMPLGNPEPVADAVAASPGSFGFSEATRKFSLPPPSGLPELNVYASRSTIDTGVQTSSFQTLYSTTNLNITSDNQQEDVTVNQSIGFRLSLPVPEFEGIRSTISGGFDFKTYNSGIDKSYDYNFLQQIPTGGNTTNTVNTSYTSPLPPTELNVRYIPLSLRWDASRLDEHGITIFGFGCSANFLGGLFPNNRTDFQDVAQSARATGYYQILTSSLSRDQAIYKQWRLSLRADGQWATQPLISNEQYGLGGVNTVRGYHEGEVFGDTGWHLTIEQKTPPATVGIVYGKTPLTVRGSIYMDYGEVYLLDPDGRQQSTPLWGTGFGGVATIGANWEARFLFSVPMRNAGTTDSDQPRFDFSLTAQF